MNTCNLEIVIDGICLGVDFDYQPEEKQTWDYPGCDAGAEILGVWIDSDSERTNIIDLLSEQVLVRIEEEIHIGAKK